MMAGVGNDPRGLGMTSQRARDRMVERLREQGILDPRVLQVMAELPRHWFIDEALGSRAYEDSSLPIGLGQTISQPYVVARMTEALIADRLPARVLEIGTGCGYQTAVLARLATQVFTVERLAELLREARQRFRKLGLHNVLCKHADGYEGWRVDARFDAIIVTAAAASLPAALLEQLEPEGVLVAPIGPTGAQRLLEIRRRADGELQQRELDLVSFVPLLPGLA